MIDPKINVLLIEDDEDDFVITRDLLSESMGADVELEWAHSYDVGLHRYQAQEHDVYLLDYYLGESTGLDFLRAVRNTVRERPVIFLTGTAGAEIDMRAMELGATDFLVKGEITPEMLERSIRYSMTHSDILQSLRHKEEELQQALAKERELSDLKSRFISMASHEIRTPLSIIQLNSYILERFLDRLTPQKRMDRFHQIHAAVEHMDQLLEEVLFIGKYDAEAIPFHPKHLDIVAFCSEIVNDFNMLASSEGNKHILVLDFCEPEVMMMADEKLLRQILTNLISNAIKYSPDGGEVLVTLGSEPNRVTLSVADEGIGIPEKDQPYIFDSFHRATNVEEIEGTGLGLVVVKRAVEMHQGQISFNNRESGGAVFTLELPRSQEMT